MFSCIRVPIYAKNLSFTLLEILLLSLVSCPMFKSASATDYVDITVVQAKTMIDADPSVVALDVRNQSEYVAGHIRNAKLIPLYELNGRMNELSVSDTIIVYCKAGGRSTTASQLLSANGFLHVYNMLGGMTDWVREQYPTYVKYTSLQEAINNATNGDTIYVSAGEYYEHLVVNMSLNLIGENRDTTIVDGTVNGTVFCVEADEVWISDFTVRYSGCACAEYCGIDIANNHQNVNVTDNNIISDGYGIQMDRARNIIIAGNNLLQNSDSCLVIISSSTVLACNNTIADNLDGVEVFNSTHCIFSNNNITSSVNGISFTDSNNNTISGNIVSFNVMYGIYVSQSNNNTLFHNAIQTNGRQVSTHNSTNFWDDGYPSGGNWWSDYNGTDVFGGPYQNATGKDGIGDTPYIIDANNSDRYPVAVTVPGDLNRDCMVDIYDAIILAGALGSKPDDFRWNPNADINSDNVVDIYDALILAGHYNQHYP